MTACLCDAGYQGEITVPESTCTECPIGTWLGIIGPGPCTDCTANAVTAATASTAITDCLCAAGHTGSKLHESSHSHAGTAQDSAARVILWCG